MSKGTKNVLVLVLALGMLSLAGCVGAKYKPLVATVDSDAEACMWVVAIRDNATDSKLFWCCSEGGEPICTEANFEELGKRQMANPFRSGRPASP